MRFYYGSVILKPSLVSIRETYENQSTYLNTDNIPGIALLVSAFAVHKTIDIYHLHLVYDTVSFVG